MARFKIFSRLKFKIYNPDDGEIITTGYRLLVTLNGGFIFWAIPPKIPEKFRFRNYIQMTYFLW